MKFLPTNQVAGHIIYSVTTPIGASCKIGTAGEIFDNRLGLVFSLATRFEGINLLGYLLGWEIRQWQRSLLVDVSASHI
jgi:hypothetical protein